MLRRGPRFLLIAMVLLGSLLVTSSPSHAGENTWTTTGPYGIQISGLYIHPTNDQVMYATVFRSNAPPVYKSTDGGVTWSPSSTGLRNGGGASYDNNHGMAFDRDDPDILYLAMEDGIYLSRNAGGAWERKSTYIENGQSKPFGAIMSIAVSPADGSILAGASMMPADIMIGGLFRSVDHGVTWERMSGLNGKSVEALAIAPGAPNIIYAGGNTGLFKSTDGGATWSSIGDAFGTTHPVWCITVDPNNSQVVYICVVNVGLFRTADGGATWQPIGAGINTDVRSLVIDPNNQQVLYAGGAFKGVTGVYRSLDNTGTNWEFFSTGMGSRDVTSIAIDRRSPQSIFAGSLAGIWKRTMTSEPADFGVSINAGALFVNTAAVTLSLTAPVGTTQMMLSNDGGFAGATWEPFQAQRAWTITSPGVRAVPRIVYAKFRTGGATSGVYQDDILLDQQRPTGTAAIVARASATPAAQEAVRARPAATNLLYLPLIVQPNIVQLRLSASDDLSGVGEMRISNRSDFAGAQWQPYTTTATWELPPQARSAYVQFRDRAMNVSGTITATYQASAP